LLNPLHLLIEVYLCLFGVIILILEMQDVMCTAGIRDNIRTCVASLKFASSALILLCLKLCQISDLHIRKSSLLRLCRFPGSGSIPQLYRHCGWWLPDRDGLPMYVRWLLLPCPIFANIFMMAQA
jgi:hypothetical protein